MTQRYSWVPVFTLIPFLYIIGWILVSPLRIFDDIPDYEVSLFGTFITFILFILVLPSWIKVRWNSNSPFSFIGISNYPFRKALLLFLRGFIYSFALILIILLVNIFIGNSSLNIDFSLGTSLNSLFLCFVVGFSEELIFRGWLLSEMNIILGKHWANFCHALLFSIVHIRFDMNIISLIYLLVGLFIFGLLLSERKKLDGQSLWGCIGLHGGLVGCWFLVQNSVIDFSTNRNELILGPGGSNPNPMGGIIGILLLIVILLIYRRPRVI